MQIIRNRELSRSHWRHELESLEQTRTSELVAGDIVVSFQRWLADWEQLLARGTKIAVRLEASESLSDLLTTEFHELWMIELVFESFAQGRGYSQARLLRERHGFLGDLRAVGDVSYDRIAFMERCGVNEFSLNKALNPNETLGAFNEVSVRYQSLVNENTTIATLRGLRRAA